MTVFCVFGFDVSLLLPSFSHLPFVYVGDGGVWALTPSGGTKELSYYNADSPSGSVVHMLPESSYLIFDRKFVSVCISFESFMLRLYVSLLMPSTIL